MNALNCGNCGACTNMPTCTLAYDRGGSGALRGQDVCTQGVLGSGTCAHEIWHQSPRGLHMERAQLARPGSRPQALQPLPCTQHLIWRTRRDSLHDHASCRHCGVAVALCPRRQDVGACRHRMYDLLTRHALFVHLHIGCSLCACPHRILSLCISWDVEHDGIRCKRMIT